MENPGGFLLGKNISISHALSEACQGLLPKTRPSGNQAHAFLCCPQRSMSGNKTSAKFRMEGSRGAAGQPGDQQSYTSAAKLRGQFPVGASVCLSYTHTACALGVSLNLLRFTSKLRFCFFSCFALGFFPLGTFCDIPLNLNSFLIPDNHESSYYPGGIPDGTERCRSRNWRIQNFYHNVTATSWMTLTIKMTQGST